jgi:hypothetical protein
VAHKAASAAQEHKSSKLVICGPSVAIYLASCYYPLATTMAPVPKYLCPCFKCKSEKERVKRTILTHFKDNLDHLNYLRASGAHQDTLSFVESCHDEIMQLLHSIDGDFDLGSSSLAGECIFTYADKYWLICLDPTSAPYPDGKCTSIPAYKYSWICLGIADAHYQHG